MALKSIVSMVKQLSKLTNEEQLRWKEDVKHVFSANLPSFEVVTWSGTDDDGIEFVSISLKDKKGNDLDSVSTDRYGLDYDELRELYSSARRSAHNINDVLDSFEEEAMSLMAK